MTGCADAPPVVTPRPFVFGQDSLAYPNELIWEYGFVADGQWSVRRREPPPEYTLQCFVVARSARQFFYHARFDPNQPMADATLYRERVREIFARSVQEPSPMKRRVVIPGYTDLFAFSRSWEALLKAEGGGVWQSYLQVGNWRLVFPFSRDHQAETAGQLLTQLGANRPPIVHLVTFPEQTINHVVLIFSALETPTGVRFAVYDPNNQRDSTELIYDRLTRTFIFPRSNYFMGGAVDVYEIYRGLLY